MSSPLSAKQQSSQPTFLAGSRSTSELFNGKATSHQQDRFPIMNTQQLREALRAGRRIYGTLIVSDSPRWPSSVAQMGLDFVFIDTEHVAIDRKELSWMGLKREIDWARDGLNFIIHGGDIIAMRESLTADVRTLRSALDGATIGAAKGADNI